MVICEFPPLATSDPTGLLALGGDLEVESLLLAYRSGIFPWPLDSETLAWFAPYKRAVLFLEDFHLSKSFHKFRRKTSLSVTKNNDFGAVVTMCSAVERPEQDGTWITGEILTGYLDLHELGFAHSWEVYDGNELVGGLYGVRIGKMFAGESMFHLVSNASKLALFALYEELINDGVTWIDCQIMTPFFKDAGAKNISRDVFMKLLNSALKS